MGYELIMDRADLILKINFKRSIVYKCTDYGFNQLCNHPFIITIGVVLDINYLLMVCCMYWLCIVMFGMYISFTSI